MILDREKIVILLEDAVRRFEWLMMQPPQKGIRSQGLTLAKTLRKHIAAYQLNPIPDLTDILLFYQNENAKGMLRFDLSRNMREAFFEIFKIPRTGMFSVASLPGHHGGLFGIVDDVESRKRQRKNLTEKIAAYLGQDIEKDPTSIPLSSNFNLGRKG